MFDALTFDQLFALHSRLFLDSTAVHARMMDKNGTALVSPFGGQWELLAAHHRELLDTMTAITDELHRRDQAANADA